MPDDRQLILSTIKQNPLFSVDKLNEFLPQFSRHFIQKFLEENQLSTVAKRLAFANELPPEPLAQPSEVEVSTPVPKLTPEPGPTVKVETPVQVSSSSLSTETPSESSPEIKQGRLKRLAFRMPNLNLSGFKFNFAPRFSRRLVPAYGLAVVLLVGLGWGVNFFKPETPEIKLDKPDVDFVQEGDNLFVAGRVEPNDSKVTVNSREVSLNGDGTFTAVVTIPMGESILKVEATRWAKSSQLLRLVKREPTEEESLALKEEETKKKLAAANKAAEVDRKVADLMAAKEATVLGAQQSFLKIINNQVREEEGFYSVVGEVVNYSDEPVRWVMITARFLDQNESLVDTKYGFATDFEEVIPPGESSEFITQPTQKRFEQYQLEISWDDNSQFMTEATVSAETETAVEATVSAE